MIPGLMKATLQRFVREPVRMLVCVMAAFLLGSVLGPTPPSLMGGLFALLFGAGIIGNEATSGTLALAFTRPIRRRDYVVAKWAAVSVAAAIATLTTIALGIWRNHMPPVDQLELAVIEQLLTIGGTSIVVVLFSAATRGYSDVGIWITGFILASLLRLYGTATNASWEVRVGKDVQELLLPTIDMQMVRNAVDMPLFAIVSYCATVVMAFAVAVVLLNRRDLSYAG
jgi:ABC-type transport system involved in multi-copper enzyme maturation permease subunit